MERLVKILAQNCKVVFDKGKFDHWCVYFIDGNGNKNAPYDVKYFAELKQISDYYGSDKVYNDFLEIYNLTNKEIDEAVLILIDKIITSYELQHQFDVEKWFSVIYAGMIAEENKDFAILKKRIKRLGMYQVLVENMAPAKAANFSRGKKWRELDELMKQKGI
ncbi:MAG: hypothetical protein U9R19_01605 [Bacteroidota bacterium]|nr:hypothetical protein [Bacteroidota bacterium]